MTDTEDIAAGFAGPRLVDAYLALKAARARVEAWTGFAIGPSMSGAGRKTDYLSDAGLSEAAIFAMIRNFAGQRLDAQAGAIEDVLAAEFGVDPAALAARAAEMLGEEIGDSGLGTRD